MNVVLCASSFHRYLLAEHTGSGSLGSSRVVQGRLCPRPHTAEHRWSHFAHTFWTQRQIPISTMRKPDPLTRCLILNNDSMRGVCVRGVCQFHPHLVVFTLNIISVPPCMTTLTIQLLFYFICIFRIKVGKSLHTVYKDNKSSFIQKALLSLVSSDRQRMLVHVNSYHTRKYKLM